MHFWSAYSLVLSPKHPPALPAHTPPPSTEQRTECTGLSSLVVTLGLIEMRSFCDQSVPRLLFSFSSFNATELRSLPLVMLLHCSTQLLHQKRKENFDLDMRFFSVPLYNFCRKTKTLLSASLVSILSGENSCFYQMSSQNF